MMTSSFSDIKDCSSSRPGKITQLLITRTCGAGPGRHIISHPNCAASLTTAALPNASTWLAPSVILHACCMLFGARSQPVACCSVMHSAASTTHLASRHQLSLGALLHHVGSTFCSQLVLTHVLWHAPSCHQITAQAAACRSQQGP